MQIFLVRVKSKGAWTMYGSIFERREDAVALARKEIERGAQQTRVYATVIVEGNPAQVFHGDRPLPPEPAPPAPAAKKPAPAAKK